MNDKIRGLPYFYDEQIRRICRGFQRIFSGFKVQYGIDDNGYPSYKSVPCVWGDMSRQGANTLNNNSENTISSLPKISFYIESVERNNERASYAGNRDTTLVIERKFDEETGKYTDKPGNRYQIEKVYFNPLWITFRVDIAVSNTDQKLQLFEQIYPLFNPSLDIQTTTNPVDWTAINVVEIQSIDWNAGRSVPAGIDEEDIMLSMIFKVDAQITPPARVKKQKLIHAIITEVGFDRTDCCELDAEFYNIITPGNHNIEVNGNEIKLLGANSEEYDENGNVFSWPQLIDQYGELRVGFSRIKLRWVNDIDADDANDIFGYIEYHPTEDNILIFSVDVDTIPQTTIDSVIDFIDPHHVFPGNGLPVASIGQRYIVTDDIGAGSVAWGGLECGVNDVIEYDGTEWFVSLSAADDTIQFVNIINTQKRMKFVNGLWLPVIDGKYYRGFWRLLL